MSEKAGRYELQSKLGEGAMAEVFRAHDPEMGRDLAVKILNERYSADANFRMRFMRESRAAGVLSHPNIVTMFDVGEVDGRPFIAMELLRGASLDQHMRAGRKFDVRASIALGIQLAEALDYAHGKGIVHRDIKPSNLILLDDDTTLKIADFGIARIEAPDITSHTQTADVLGTPQYMSPEQVLGKKVDGRSDLFSVGIVLYQLLSGEKPFVAETLGTLLFRIASESPRPLREANPNLPAALYAIVNRLLNKEPEQRFANGAELANALRAALGASDTADNATRSGGDLLMWGTAAGVFLVVGAASAWYWSSKDAAVQRTAMPQATVAEPPQGSLAGVAATVAPNAEPATATVEKAAAVSPATTGGGPVPPAADVPPLSKRVAEPMNTAPSAKASTEIRTSPPVVTTAPKDVKPVIAPGPASTPPRTEVRTSEPRIDPPVPATAAPTPSVPTPKVGETSAPAKLETQAATASRPVVDPAATMSITQAKQQYREGKLTKEEYRALVDKIKQRYRDAIAKLKEQLRGGVIDKRTYKEKAQELERGYE